jgi:amino acid permease
MIRITAALRLLCALWLLPSLLVLELAEKMENPEESYFANVKDTLQDWWESVVEYSKIIRTGKYPD